MVGGVESGEWWTAKRREQSEVEGWVNLQGTHKPSLLGSDVQASTRQMHHLLVTVNHMYLKLSLSSQDFLHFTVPKSRTETGNKMFRFSAPIIRNTLQSDYKLSSLVHLNFFYDKHDHIQASGVQMSILTETLCAVILGQLSLVKELLDLMGQTWLNKRC